MIWRTVRRSCADWASKLVGADLPRDLVAQQVIPREVGGRRRGRPPRRGPSFLRRRMGTAPLAEAAASGLDGMAPRLESILLAEHVRAV